MERKLDFTITAFYDRTTCNPFKYQLGYLDVIVQPLFDSWVDFREAFREVTKGLDENRKMIEAKVEETKAIQNTNDKVGAS